MQMHTRIRGTVALVLALLGAGCGDITVPNYNAPSVDALTGTPTVTTVNTAASGMLISLRALANTYAGTMGILGREVYNLDPSEPRNVNGYLVGPLEPGGFGTDFGWTASYRTVLHGNYILTSLERLPDMSAAQKEATRGYTKTIQALTLLGQARIRDDFGIVIQVTGDRQGDLSPLVSKTEAYAHINKLLDEALAHLQAAGTGTFPFLLHSGFAEFNTPSRFIQFNRAIRARSAIDTKDYAGVLTALEGSFVSTTRPLTVGAYHVFSTSSGDAVNTLFDTAPVRWVAHPTFLADAQRRTDGSPDLRASSKARTGARTLSQQGVSSNLVITVYGTNTASMPIIRNEELILLRAEANYFRGDRDAAMRDINLVRTTAGGLAPIADPGDPGLVTELLYNRRYSLFFEYGHRWVDMRRLGRLNELPKALPTHRVFPAVPLPVDECLPRTTQPAGCTQVNGS